MQNPFKPRSSDDFGRGDRDDSRWEARDQRYDEGRTWSEGDGGRTAEAWRGQGEDRGRQDRDPSAGYGYGRQSQSDYGRGMSTPYSGDRARPGSSYDQYGYGAQSGGREAGGQDRSQGFRSPDQGWRGSQSDVGRGGSFGQSSWGWDQGSGRGDHDQGRSISESGREQGRSGDYSAQGYAPGADIWRGQGDDRGRSSQSHHDFEPDYMHWRDQQVSQFDKDYSEWRNERRQKFSSDFDSWRSSRPQVKAENPIVGDVSDGGVGSAEDAKKD